MPATNADTTHPILTDQILKNKYYNFKFRKVSVEEVKQLLMSINNNKPPGYDNLDGKLLRIKADDIATPICLYIFKLSLQESVCPLTRREAKAFR